MFIGYLRSVKLLFGDMILSGGGGLRDNVSDNQRQCAEDCANNTNVVWLKSKCYSELQRSVECFLHADKALLNGDYECYMSLKAEASSIGLKAIECLE